MPDIQIVPASTRDGVIDAPDGLVGGQAWALALNIEKERYKHFSMAKDARNVRWSQVLTGFAGGTFNIEAKHDTNATFPFRGIWLDAGSDVVNDPYTFYLGFNDRQGFIVTVVITDMAPADNTGSPGGAMFNFSGEVVACDWTEEGP